MRTPLRLPPAPEVQPRLATRRRPSFPGAAGARCGGEYQRIRGIGAGFRIVRGSYREHGLEPGWHDVLATLRRTGPPYRPRPTEFTGSLMLTSSGTTKRPDRLERAGLIERAPDPDDRRGVIITLTDAGRELIDRVTEAHMANEARLLEGLSAAERDRLAALLRKLTLCLPPR